MGAMKTSDVDHIRKADPSDKICSLLWNSLYLHLYSMNKVWLTG